MKKMDEIKSTSNFVTAPPKNVGTRVSSWLTEFADEASRKSFSTLRKWIHSSKTTERPSSNIMNSIKDTMYTFNKNEVIGTENTDATNICEHSNKIKEILILESKTQIDNELNISEDQPANFKSFERPLKLGLLGRASTLQEMSALKPLLNLRPKNNKNTYQSISRCYSVQQDELNKEYNNSFLMNRRSQSLTQVHGKKEDFCYQRDIVNDNKHNKQNKISNSLPSFLDLSGIYNNALKNEPELMSYKRDKLKNLILRGNSYHSDSSHCSSVDSLLDSRKPDPEAILINLGFGPIESENILSKIPKRFLQPSQVKGIDTEAFLRRQQMASNIHDHTVLGYRGLVGNPDIAPSTIVAKIMERFEFNERNRNVPDINRPQSAPPNSLEIYKS